MEILTILGVTVVTSVISLAGGFALLSGSKAAKTFQKISMVLQRSYYYMRFLEIFCRKFSKMEIFSFGK